MKKCSYASKYKAIRPPHCNAGIGCDVCKAKWKAKHDVINRSKVPAVKSYYGGEITEAEKAAHEQKLAEILSRADGIPDSLNNVMAQYRKFVVVAGQQREPFVTGNHKADQRLLAAVGSSGENGEVNNHIKKLMFRKKVGGGEISTEDREKIISELGDEFWYFMLKLIAFDIEFPDVVFGNMRKLVKRGR